ncbi:MAG: NAD(P)/FAD-dependent oxidoreductase, partial [Anaerolineae bacterium]|nr:NAD(P)/FAD-dependent oxidoreductase [Anaerolineae bacterium]
MTGAVARQITVIGAGIGGLTTAALLAHAGYSVTVLEAQTYPGGCASTFTHQGYRFDAGATVAGGFQENGPHALVGKQLGIRWPVRRHDPAWVVHLPDREIALTRDNADVLRNFPASERFWKHQYQIADLGWSLSAQGLPWPPTSLAEFLRLTRVGLRNLPKDLLLLPLAIRTAYQWLQGHGLAQDISFVRFIDAQLLISAQTTSRNANAAYSATALDLARQGVFHVEGGIGGLAETLVDTIRHSGGQVLYRQRVNHIHVEGGRVTGVSVQAGRQSRKVQFIPCDFLIANLTPWSLDKLLDENSPASLRREVAKRPAGWGAFALHVGVESSKLPPDLLDHHQFITTMAGDLGEGRSIFLSMSPAWDKTRAPDGHRAVTITTHTAVQPWWDLIHRDKSAYEARKHAYAERLLDAVERAIPGFRASIRLALPGSPVTYQFYINRHLGMVGGFPQKSLLKARGPRVGIPNLRLVGDSIFPGQSTAGVTLGAMRVAEDVRRVMPIQVSYNGLYGLR